MLQILKLIEESSFDFLDLEMGDLKLTVSKGEYGEGAGGKRELADLSYSVTFNRSASDVKDTEAETQVEQPKRKQADVGVTEGTVSITAPIVGTFYTTPEPGAGPFVELGGQVDEDTTVGLIEVMKVFNAVRSTVRGVIAEICVQNGQFVECGQTLFRVIPEGVSSEEGPSR